MELEEGCEIITDEWVLSHLAIYLNLSFEQLSKLNNEGKLRSDWIEGWENSLMRRGL